MGVLQRFEQRVDRMINGAFARTFRSEVQPVEVASALQRELDDKAALVTRDRTVAPNRFTVTLGQHDYDRLAVYAEPLQAELGDMVTEHAEEQRYALAGPVEVVLELDDSLNTGVFNVSSKAVPGVMARSAQSAGLTAPVTAARLVIGTTSYPLTELVTTIGRGLDCEIRIADPGVSRRHAQIRLPRRSGAEILIADLASTNGTYVNNVKVDEADLVDGDVITIGSATATFRIG